MTKDIIWQRFNDESVPVTGALVFSCLLALVTIWFTLGAVGPWVALLGLGLGLVTLAFGSSRLGDLLIPLFLGFGAIGLGLFSGGLASAGISAVLWPLLATTARGGRIEHGLGASVCVLVGLALVSVIVELPPMGALGTQSGILAIGVCAALAVATYLRHDWRKSETAHPAQAQINEANRRRDDALAQAYEANAQTQGRAQFMAEMSHEIRTPLNAILGFADTMREGVFGPLPQAYSDYPTLIHASGTHLLDIVSDLLDLSKIEAGRYETQLKPLQLDEVAHDGVRLSSGAARASGVQIRHEAGPPIEIAGDARALRQIVFNLLSNAIKFTPSGGRVIVRVKPDMDNQKALLEVEDNGVGISEADLRKIGEPWNQSSVPTSGDAKTARGSGLGLALVKRLSELQGGQFEITSQLGAGTRATVSFPIATKEIS